MDEDHRFKPLKVCLQSPADWQKMVSTLEQSREHKSYAAQRAGIMFGCYRKAEASDPEIYAAATAAVLSEYPREIIDYITDPRTGLPSKSQWLPSVFEVRKACEEHKEYLGKLAQLEAMKARRDV